MNNVQTREQLVESYLSIQGRLEEAQEEGDYETYAYLLDKANCLCQELSIDE